MTASMRTCPKCGATFGADVLFCHNDGTVLDQSAGHLTGQIIADRYRVISQIGEGGMGKVYLAEHVHMKRKCAVKFLHPDLAGSEGALKRFIREASNASRIDHPNVVTIYDFGEAAGGAVYLAMEFVEGETLRKRIERDTSIPRDVMASIIRQTASALQAAHAMGIVHRDLKPDNIMLITRDGDVRAKVVDFGIAKAKGAEQKVTVTGAIVGTPDYMSPEQLLGNEVDGRADQYALALVAVKMLTGKLPFATTTSIESLTSRLTTNPIPLRALRADIAWPQQLQDVIARALSSDPAQRYASVMDFSRAFDKALGRLGGALAVTVADLPVGMEIIPPTQQRAPKAGRSRWPIAAAATVVVLAGGSFGVWYGGRGTLPSTDTQQLAARVETSPLAAVDSSVRQQADPASVKPAVVIPPTPAPTLFSKTSEPMTVARNQSPNAQPFGKQSLPTAQRDTAPEPAPRPSRDSAVPEPPPAPARPSVPPTLASSEIGSELAAIRPLVVPDAPAASLATAVSRINALLPRAGERSDSIRLLYVRAQAQALQEDLGNACKTLSAALGLAKGSSLESALTRTSAQLNCP